MAFQGEIFDGMMNTEGVDTISLVIVGLTVVLFSWIVFKVQQTKSRDLVPLPPGPRPLPIIGNLHMWGRLPHRRLRELSRNYGPLMFLRLGCVPTVVASSPEMAKQFLKTHDLNFASRPPTTVGKNMLYNTADIAFAPYGYHWRQMRKMCVVELLSSKRLESLMFAREEEISALVHSILQHSLKISTPVNIRKKSSALITNIIYRMILGRKYSEDALDGYEMIHEILYLTGAINIGDFIPWLEWMDLQGLRRRQKKCNKTFDAFLDRVIDEHSRQKNLPKDFMDVMLEISEDQDMEIKVTRDNIKAVTFDMLAGGSESSVVTIEWPMSELLKNPSLMKKVKDELESAIGGKRKVEECDLHLLQYLKAVVKETLRVHPPGPLLLPHESLEACIVDGYRIPPKTRVIVNVWAIHRDPTLWEDPDIFNPERFIGTSMDMKGLNFEMLPFGSGRRGCPGMSLAMLLVECTLANLLHCFDWRLPDGMKPEDLDMREEFGLTTARAVNLLAVPTARFV